MDSILDTLPEDQVGKEDLTGYMESEGSGDTRKAPCVLQNTIGRKPTSMDLEGERESPEAVHSGRTLGPLQRAILFRVKEEPREGLDHCWEAQWQEFLRTVEFPSSSWGPPQPLEELNPWDNATAFLASFEQVAGACRWPKEEWVSQLLPALSGEAELAFSSLEAGDREDYGKVKAIILRWDALTRERWRQHFRHFRYHEAEGPRGVYGQLQELCRQWLKVERHTKEQILELLILEQFLTILPSEIQSWVRARSPESCFQAVALAEDFLQKQQEKERWEQQEPLEEVTVGFSGEEHRQNQLHRESKEENEDLGLLADTRPGNDHNVRYTLQERLEEAEPFWTSQRFPESSPRDPEHEREIQNQHRPKTQQGNHLKNRTVVSLSSALNRKVLGETSLLQTQKINHVSGEGIRTDLGGNTPIQERPYHKCSICGKTFGQSSYLLFHQRTHDLEKPYKCMQCGSSFHSRQGLIYHQRSHAGEKPFKCSFCGKTFSQSSHLLVHKRSHTGEKPFKCSACGKCFSRNSLLTIHERTHTGEKPYKCSQCGSRFHSGSGLINHKRIHAGVKPYKCTECGRDFIRKAHLTRHQSIHSEDKTGT